MANNIATLSNMGIYSIANTATKDIYIGSSGNIKLRWKTHRDALNKNKHHSRKLQDAWNEYGTNAFAFTVLETVSASIRLLHREQEWINSLQPKYNMTLSVRKGPVPTYPAYAQDKQDVSLSMQGHTSFRTLLTVTQIAASLNITEEKVAKLLRAGELTGMKLGKEWRIDPDDLQKFITESKKR